MHVVIRDDTGAPMASVQPIQLTAGDHFQFGLADQFPVTANKRGTIEFDTPSPGQISVLGLRFTPPNNALTTIPALANVGTGGGSIAHLASGGDGWQTTFVLVNAGTSCGVGDSQLFTPIKIALIPAVFCPCRFLFHNPAPLTFIQFPRSLKTCFLGRPC